MSSKEKRQHSNRAEEKRNQTKLIMQPYANWEEYLTPASISIAILGELVFISSQTDFSINKNLPKGYKYIRYADSFRTCLMQVCNSGWGAFNEAHKNMDQIRLHMMTVPDYMKTAVKILFQGNDEVVQAHLPDQLKNIRVIADDCLCLAQLTEEHFIDVMNINQEVLEACVHEYFNTTIQMLVKGIDAMVRVKEQLEKMVRFFQMVSNIVKTCLTSTLNDLISTSEKTQDFSKDLLYNQAFQATNIASLVHMISATYTDVSEKYLMYQVSSMGKLIMDKEKPEFEHERVQLQNSCDEAQKAILRLVLKNKDEFERKTIARLEKIDSELLAILPEAAPGEMKSIQAAVESGFTEEEEDAYA